MTRIWVVSLTLAALVPIAEPAPPDVDKKLVAGIWTLTTQEEAVTVEDITRALHLDARKYTPRVDQAGQKTTYERTASLDIDSDSPVRLFSFTTVIISLPISPWLPPKPQQSINVLFKRGMCLSAKTIAAQTGATFRSHYPPIMSIARSTASDTDASAVGSAAQGQHNKTYFARIEGNPGGSKIKAIENILVLQGECSQEIAIGKDFDYDYWSARCPFNYTEQLVNSIVIPTLKGKYGREYTRYAIDHPQIKDYGAFMALTFNQAITGAGPQTQFAMEVDRCDLNVNRTWEVPGEVPGKKTPP